MYSYNALVNAFGVGMIIGMAITTLIAKTLYKGD